MFFFRFWFSVFLWAGSYILCHHLSRCLVFSFNLLLPFFFIQSNDVNVGLPLVYFPFIMPSIAVVRTDPPFCVPAIRPSENNPVVRRPSNNRANLGTPTSNETKRPPVVIWFPWQYVNHRQYT